MKRTLRIIAEIISETFSGIKYFVKSNLRNFVTIINILLPYAMYFIGQYVAVNREKIAVGGELFIPIAICVFTYLIRSYANKIGKGITIPVPDKRFTEIDDDGEVSIENNRIQELILYIADLEDWLERKGML